MQSLREIISDAEQKKVAIGHFNISDITALHAIFESAQELSVPIIIGVSEGEREFIGTKQAVALVKSLREQYDYPIFINADHTYSLEKIKEAVDAGFDAVIFDGAKLPIEENIKKTKEVVEYVKKSGKDVLVEAEIGYIGASSKLLDAIPEGAKIEEKDLPTEADVKKFVQETGIDLLAPAVGNIHGMFKGAPNPNLQIELIKNLRDAAGVPLVLHGGSGIKDEQFTEAIKAGIAIVHINTEIRVAWRKGIETGLSANKDEIAPYKILPQAKEEIKKVVLQRLKLFNNI